MKTLGPDVLPEANPEIVRAYRAVARGTASPHQQRLMLRHLLDNVCGLLVADGVGLNERAAGFTAGKRWVGLSVAQLAKLAVLEFPLLGDE